MDQAQHDFQDFAIIGDAEGSLEDGFLVLRVDLRPDDQESEVERLVDMGARPVDIGQHDVGWVVLADPEGNEFCVLSSRK